jgi:hypothetical protein
MKTFYLTTLLLTLGIASNAQTQKGTININGQFGGNNGATRDEQNGGAVKKFSFQANPNVGYFIKDNWEVGAGVSFGRYQINYKNPDPWGTEKYNSNRLGLLAYSKYYFGKGLVKPYLTINGGHNWLFNKTIYTTTGEDKYKAGFWNVGGGAGLTWFASSRVGLFTQLTYDRNWNPVAPSNGALNLNFGVQVNLGKKK